MYKNKNNITIKEEVNKIFDNFIKNQEYIVNEEKHFNYYISENQINKLRKLIINNLIPQLKTLEQQREEIIAELNEKTNYINTSFKKGRFNNISIVGEQGLAKHAIICNYYDGAILFYDVLPIELAHKITSYFMELNRSKEE